MSVPSQQVNQIEEESKEETAKLILPDGRTVVLPILHPTDKCGQSCIDVRSLGM